MAMDDTESCSSRAMESSPTHPRQLRQKLQVYNDVLRRLKYLNIDEANHPGFDDELWNHFTRLPARYALDVNVERAEDVLTHKRLLQLAHDPNTRPAIEVRLVQVSPVSDGNSADSFHSNSSNKEETQSSFNYLNRNSIHPPPAFGSSPNLEALALEANEPHDPDNESTENTNPNLSRPMHEITFSTDDKPKLLSQLTSLLAEIGLNIREAHAFSTVDGYSLDVFVVDGWPHEETEQLRHALEKEIWRIEKQPWSKSILLSPSDKHEEHVKIKIESTPDHVKIPTDGTDVWEIDPRLLKCENKVASGSFGDLYKGTYCSQDVAIKVLKPERVSADMQREFAQEVYIMRKVRHKNVVQFIGACTRPPRLCIVTEYMSGGSVYDYLHKQKGVFKLPSILKVAIDVSKGMDYLHQNNIIHRDLKAANLLMDENEVIKVADFGVARVQTQSGVMTAETGTYRWMAPEHPDLTVTSEERILDAILVWGMLAGELCGWEAVDALLKSSSPEYLFGDRLESVKVLLSLVRFPLMPHTLLNKLAKSNFCIQIPIFEHLVIEAINYIDLGITYSGDNQKCEDDCLPSISWVLHLAKAAVFRHGVRGLVIDPYNELDHQRPPNQFVSVRFVIRLLAV